MIDKSVVTGLVEEKLKESDSFLVDVQIKPGNFIVVEIDNENGINIDECIAISRFIEEHFDREVEDFELEVGSAGVTSPFKVLRQYQKNIGNNVEVLSRKGIKLNGVLTSADENGFVITITKKVKPEGAKRKIEVQENIPFTYDEVKHVKYLIDFK
ncbi:MAG: ribosome assembly cofactor RimP [Bacteroidales bacterium]